MEGDLDGLAESINETAFQSTPSAWRETKAMIDLNTAQIFQSTPSAWRETYLPISYICMRMNFNPLPPHGGRPCTTSTGNLSQLNFNPLPPHGGRQRLLRVFEGEFGISIHSLRMEGDRVHQEIHNHIIGFQSTPSAWRETVRQTAAKAENKFQSTPSAWRETFFHD